MPDLRGGAITAEDLEASFHTKPDKEVSETRPRLPPGFGGLQGLPHPLIHQQLLQRHMMEQNNLRQRQLSGDILGIQGLANLGLPDNPSPGALGQGPPLFGPGPFGPMMLTTFSELLKLMLKKMKRSIHNSALDIWF